MIGIPAAVSQATPPTEMIALKDVHLDVVSAAGKVNILRGINLTVDAGEKLAVIGPSGSGKSTMMMVIGGLDSATMGRVVVAGKDLTGLSEDALARFRRQHVGIVFQNFHLIPTMTAMENVAVPLELARRRDSMDAAKTALEAVGLGHRLTHYPAQLSGGEQQRCAIARAVVGAPKLILADEPTGNLDGETGRQIIDLLFTLARQNGSTFVLITHDRALADECDRVVQLVDGRIADDGRGAAQAAQ